jgi:histidinol-phosphate aminotransferase
VDPSVSPAPSPHVAGLEPYAPPRPGAPVDLRLDGNEGAAPPAALLEELSRFGPDLLRHYPSAREIEALLADMHDVSPARVLVTAGADDAIDRLCRALLSPGRSIVLPTPTFEMLSRYARIAGAERVEISWPGELFPTAEFIAAFDPTTALVVVVSPNNPTGAVATRADLQRLAAAAPHAVLLVDLAYVEFADEDPTQMALALPNAVVVRTLSKAWGLAGLRVGYALGPPEILRWMRAAGAPYSISSPSLALAAARLRGPRDDMGLFVTRIREERAALTGQLVRLGARPLPSQANFVLSEFPNATWVRDGLAGLGIAVRGFAPAAGPGGRALERSLRITCPGDPEPFARLTTGLETVLAPEAILLDLDGVLSDVSGSYRRAILETARSFGVRLEPAEIAAAKNAGSANNDWELTHRLLERHGVEAGLPEVTRRFEGLYQGTPDEPGLRLTERALVSREVLRQLAARLPLAVVTGRPRADASRFLEEAGLVESVGALVCMEDAPSKPDPAPVRLALERLGVRRAWMVGDTPDDVRAARAARVVPLGIVAPGDDPSLAAPSLVAAGASRILGSLAQLEDLLP